MRLLGILILWLLAAPCCLASEIDQLRSLSDVTTFLRLRSKVWKNEMFFELGTADTISSGHSRFYKLDLDGNGLTDLVVDGKYRLAVTDDGASQYSIHFIDKLYDPDIENTQLRRIIYLNGALLLVQSIIEHYDLRTSRLLNVETRTDSLAFKYGNFLEYRATPVKLKIALIRFSVSCSGGICADFDFVVRSSRRAVYQASGYNVKEGVFRRTIDTATHNQLLAAPGYIHVASLNDNYEIASLHASTRKLEITFSDGQVKRITDYGGIGTYGLANL